MGAEVGDEVVLVNPNEVVEVMRKVLRGKVVTIVEICKHISKAHGELVDSQKQSSEYIQSPSKPFFTNSILLHT